jgi:hypothetical protein
VNRYRVYYQVPAHRYVTVEAESEDEAKLKADEIESDGAFVVDDEGEEEHAFTVQV